MRLYIKISCAAMIAAAVSTTGCSKLLQENPKSGVYTNIFNTPSGLLGGISGVYNDIRSLWGTEGWEAQLLAGTDEVLEGASASSPDFYTYNPLLSTDENGGLWNIAYQDINTLNGILQFGKTIAIDTGTQKLYFGQCKFLRAFYYLHLVQNWGAVPLHLTYITTPTLYDSRQPIDSVYAQIIQDLTDASTELSPTPTAPFLGKPATQPVALYLLGKAYLSRGYSSAGTPTDFSTAASILSGIITNASTYGLGLWQDYGDAFKPANDYGKETMFVSDHDNDPKYGQYTVGGSASGGVAQNLEPWFFIFNYPSLGGNAAITGGVLKTAGPSMMTRDIYNGRPYIRTRPNNAYILGEAFSDTTNDSRFYKTFQTVWICNTANVTTSRGTLTVGVDTAIWVPPYEVSGAPQADSGRPFKGIIIPPSIQDKNYFFVVKKFMDPSRPAADFNDPSTRPFVLYRFSDVYLLAAEAYFKAGDNVNAAKYINAIRERAAYRSWQTSAQNAASATAADIQPGDVTLDFILDERTREFYAEGLRWFDLARTQSLLERVQKWNPVEAGAHIQAFHQLRPIPQTQIDAITEGPAFPQNPGY
jgi:hypothetical protein